MTAPEPIILAVPKGRILDECEPLLRRAGLQAEAAFYDEHSRALRFATNLPHVELIRVRSFDVATFVAYGAAHLGIAGSDVLHEFSYPDLYAPLNLGIGKCRLAVAERAELAEGDDSSRWSHVRIATKYPHITQRYFAERGVQAECIKLNGALELAPTLGMCRRIVDLVSTGATLRANGLVEIETVLEVASYLIVNRSAYKTRYDEMSRWIQAFREAVHASAA